MKDDHVWESHDDDEPIIREKIVIGRMRWDFERGVGMPLKDDGGTMTLDQFSAGRMSWVEVNDRQKGCGYWEHVPKSMFKEVYKDGGDDECAFCFARRVS